MNKTELASEIADRAQIRHTTVLAVLDRLEDVVTEQIKGGGQVLITGFCKFTAHDQAATVRRNPKTGEPVQVPAKRVPRIKAMATLRESVAAGS